MIQRLKKPIIPLEIMHKYGNDVLQDRICFLLNEEISRGILGLYESDVRDFNEVICLSNNLNVDHQTFLFGIGAHFNNIRQRFRIGELLKWNTSVIHLFQIMIH